MIREHQERTAERSRRLEIPLLVPTFLKKNTLLISREHPHTKISVDNSEYAATITKKIEQACSPKGGTVTLGSKGVDI